MKPKPKKAVRKNKARPKKRWVKPNEIHPYTITLPNGQKWHFNGFVKEVPLVKTEIDGKELASMIVPYLPNPKRQQRLRKKRQP